MAQATRKRSKRSVRYQETPKDGEHCADCVHFLPPHACEGVAGDISPNGWCIRFKRKQVKRKWYGKEK
jgi:hypothetical protein